MIDLILEQMQHDKPRELLCTDEAFTYCNISIAGFYLMYRTTTHRPDGRRCYFLTNELAMCLGFHDLHQMHLCLTTLQYWRRFVSVQRLRVAIDRYHHRQERFRQMAQDIEI